MELTGTQATGATPLSEEDVRGLRIDSITTQGELNEAEAQNIIRGQEWALRSRTVELGDMLTDEYLQRLHIEMFGGVWRWAGSFRQRETNIGVAPHRIRTDLRELYNEVRGWLHYSVYPSDEIAVRLHYRVVTIHPFPNGNGRHARMLAHIAMVRHFRQAPLPWSGDALCAAGDVRKAYINALIAADGRDFAPLLSFARSSG